MEHEQRSVKVPHRIENATMTNQTWLCLKTLKLTVDMRQLIFDPKGQLGSPRALAGFYFEGSRLRMYKKSEVWDIWQFCNPLIINRDCPEI